MNKGNHRQRPLPLFRWWALVLALAMVPRIGLAEIELAPFAGFRAGAEFDLRDDQTGSQGTVDFDDGESFGIVLNVDLDEPGKQAELYYGRQLTTARTSENFLVPGNDSFALEIHQLQFGGLYFPGGQSQGGFVSGVIGVTRLAPKDSRLRSHHRASLALGGGFKMPVSDALLLRLDLRGIYTALDTGGSVFCAGGCAVRVQSSGYVQIEAGAGLVLRF